MLGLVDLTQGYKKGIFVDHRQLLDLYYLKWVMVLINYLNQNKTNLYCFAFSVGIAIMKNYMGNTYSSFTEKHSTIYAYTSYVPLLPEVHLII